MPQNIGAGSQGRLGAGSSANLTNPLDALTNPAPVQPAPVTNVDIAPAGSAAAPAPAQPAPTPQQTAQATAAAGGQQTPQIGTGQGPGGLFTVDQTTAQAAKDVQDANVQVAAIWQQI